MGYVLLACQGVLAVVLLIASVSKMFNHEQFLAALRLSDIRRGLLKPLTVLVPVLEFCLALGLVLNVPHVLSFVISLAVVLLCIFTLWMFRVYSRGLRLKCGCFGTGGSDIGPRSIVRNSILIVLAGSGLILSFHVPSSLPTPSFWFVVTVLSFGMSITLLWAFQQALAGLNLSLGQMERARERTATSSQ